MKGLSIFDWAEGACIVSCWSLQLGGFLDELPPNSS